ncbi:MAG: DEAD/DEAH box helicase [Alphaproteobacteria bacterium]
MDDTTPKPANQGKRWNAADDATLAAGLRDMQGTFTARFHLLAETLGRTKTSVESRAHLLDLLDYGRYTAIMNDKTPHPEGADILPFGTHWNEDDTARLLIAHEVGDALEPLAANLRRTPRACAYKLVQLGQVIPTLKANPTPPPITYAKPKPEPKRVEQPASTTQKIQVTPEFQTALKTIQEGENLLILGSAGTGKSTFLKWLRKNLNDTKRKYAVLAPTGMAALNVGGQTIHSFFSFKPQLLVGQPVPKARYPKVIENLELIIIDEISMVRADVFDAMDKFLRKHGKFSKKPFGGVQLVLMGDLCQLPPVVRREEAEVFATTYPNPFFFATPAWELGAFSTLRFTHIFRQTDAPFINLLNSIRSGNNGSGVLGPLNARVVATPPENAVILAARNSTVDAINATELAKLNTPTRTYHADTTGDLAGKEFTTPAELTLKVGAKVMFTRNDKLGRWVNGTLGHVLKLTDDNIEVRTDRGVFEVEREKWESTRYQAGAEGTPVATVAGTFVQFPLALAWALTIHKAQGQTLERCVIDLADGGTFAEGQLYVALSRATSLEGLYLTQAIQPRHVKTHSAVVAFYETLDR